MLAGKTMAGVWGASTGLGQEVPRVTPAETKSQEAWPGPEPLGLASLWREPRWNADRRGVPPPTLPRSGGGGEKRQGRVAAPVKRCGGLLPSACRRFRFPFSLSTVQRKQREAVLLSAHRERFQSFRTIPRTHIAARERKGIVAASVIARSASDEAIQEPLALSAGLLR